MNRDRAVNGIVLTAVETLHEMIRALRERRVALNLAQAREPRLERLCRTPLPGELEGGMFRRAAQAYDRLAIPSAGR